jgi:hypothetical protein
VREWLKRVWLQEPRPTTSLRGLTRVYAAQCDRPLADGGLTREIVQRALQHVGLPCERVGGRFVVPAWPPK